VTRLFLNVFF